MADGIVYFGAGIWPSEGIFIYALDAAPASRLWCNDSSGGDRDGPAAPRRRPEAASPPRATWRLPATRCWCRPAGRCPRPSTAPAGRFATFHLQANRPGRVRRGRRSTVTSSMAGPCSPWPRRGRQQPRQGSRPAVAAHPRGPGRDAPAPRGLSAGPGNARWSSASDACDRKGKKTRSSRPASPHGPRSRRPTRR